MAIKYRTAFALGLGFASLLGSGKPALTQGKVGPKLADAKPGEICVLATGAIRVPLDQVLDQAAKAVGHPLVVEYGLARGNLKDEILAGQAFEVAILLPDVNEEIAKAGKTMPGTASEIARVPVGIGLRGDVPIPDVSTPFALKKAMLAAKSIKYIPSGAASLTVQKLIVDLKITDMVHDTSKTIGTVNLGAGEYELNFYPLSEIIPNKELKNLGPVIANFQVPVIIAAVIGSNASDVNSAKVLIKFLQGPQMDAALRSDGMMKGVRNPMTK